jgi:hypothetical protein
MYTYKLFANRANVIVSVNRSDGWAIPLTDPANTDYAEFKKAVTAGAELQDASGEVMSQADAEAFVKTLP